MLYLAEVHKKGGFRAKTELKLLARKQSEHNWLPVSGEEFVPADASNDYNHGVLVLVELDNHKNVKSVQDATRQLVGILKNFSRMRDKFRTQEEEIEGWKQSLIYQSQELTRREVDMESRAEELQQLETEAQKIDQQRQEFESSRDQILQLKEQLEGDRQQLEEAWGRLQAAQRQFDSAQAAALSDEQVHHIEGLLSQLDASVGQPSEPATQTIVDAQQAVLTPQWQTLEQERARAEQLQQEVEHQASDLEQAWQAWRQTQASLEDTQLELKLQEKLLADKTDNLQFLTTQVQAQADVTQALRQVREGFTGNIQVNLQVLRSMPLEELEETVSRLQQELDKLSSFVNDQEEELELQRQEISSLEARMSEVSEYDRLTLAGDLEQEQQQYQLLNETLEGQRKTLQEREGVLHLHQDILKQRQMGKGRLTRPSVEVKLEPILQQLESQQEESDLKIHSLKNEIARMQTAFQATQDAIAGTAAEQQTKQAALEAQEQALKQKQLEATELWAKVNTLQEILQPIQDVVDTHRDQTADHDGAADNGTPTAQVITELKQVLMDLGKAPDLTPVA